MALLQQLRSVKSRRDATAAQRQNDEELRRSRFSDAWGRLSGRLDNWFKSLVMEDLIKIVKTDEKGETAYHIDVVDVDAGTIRTSLIPFNNKIVGAEGRVDIKVQDNLIYQLILFNDGHWELWDALSRKVTNRSFTALEIETLLEQTLISVALA
jgi:hypothetical protein